MKSNKLSIIINKDINLVFEYTTNPQNTHLWIDSIEKEIASKYPPQIGTIYKNHDGSENWDEYIVTDFKMNSLFQLTSKDEVYTVRYNYTDIGGKTEMEYYEWVEEGLLSNPLLEDTLQKLKQIIEK